MKKILVVKPGLRPAPHSVAVHLWGEGCDIDSDGDSERHDDPNWSELTLVLRSTLARIDVDPEPGPALALKVRSKDEHLCKKAAKFIADQSGGALVDDA